jgi:DNA-directed RNA polymerase subunit RPC12/RpoP
MISAIYCSTCGANLHKTKKKIKKVKCQSCGYINISTMQICANCKEDIRKPKESNDDSDDDNDGCSCLGCGCVIWFGIIVILVIIFLIMKG